MELNHKKVKLTKKWFNTKISSLNKKKKFKLMKMKNK